MNACIITIGDEIIDGNRLDTNSQWIANKIAKYKIKTDKIISIGDSQANICDEILESVDKFNFIFITGGLGPTHDDITLSSFQRVFNLKSRVDSEYLKRLAKAFEDRGIEMPKINQNQGLILDFVGHGCFISNIKYNKTFKTHSIVTLGRIWDTAKIYLVVMLVYISTKKI